MDPAIVYSAGQVSIVSDGMLEMMPALTNHSALNFAKVREILDPFNVNSV